MNVKYILIVFLIGICLISPIYASDNQTDLLESPQSNIINITNDNYNDYFEKFSGTILEEANISSGDTLQIGNVTNKVFVIDRQLEITTISGNDLIKNGYVKLINGSDGSVIHGLRIINDKLNFYTEGIMSSNLHGIGLFYTDNNTLYDNYVQLAQGFKVHALPMGSSSNNRIFNNTFISTMSTCVPMSDCHNNIFCNNYLQTTQANIIYYNRYGHADYGGPERCVNNTYIGNTLNSINRDSEWIIAFAVGSYDVHILNNTVTNVYTGVDSLNENSTLANNRFVNNTNVAVLSYYAASIINNSFENVNMAIAVLNENTTISNNAFINASIAIWSMADNTVIENNTFDIFDSFYAVTLEGKNGKILNNSITVRNYGEAIRLLGENTTINGNLIKSSADSAVYVLSSNNVITDNIIISDLYGVYIDAESSVRYYDRSVTPTTYRITYDQGDIINNLVSKNIIDSDSYGVYLRGTVYNTTITENNITTKESTGILIDVTDPFSNTILDNIVNGQFINYTGVILSDDTFDIYFDENGTFKFADTDKSVLLLITYLTDKEMIINNEMEITSGIGTNLLSNVHFILLNESNGTVIHDLTFRNTKKPMISILGSRDIEVYNIDYYLSSDSDEALNAINLDSSSDVKITDNNIYLRGKNNDIEGVNVNNSSALLLNNNTMILESDKSINAYRLTALNSSRITDNSIQIYGAGEFNALEIENAADLELMNNMILASSTSNITNINLLNSSGIRFYKNDFDVYSRHTRNIISNSDNVSFESNNFKEISTGIIADYLIDISSSENVSLSDSLIYSNALNTGDVELSHNRFVIYDGNINSFFNNDGEFKSDIIDENDTILFDNLKLRHYDLIFSQVMNISSYSKASSIDATLIFNEKASGSNIACLTFTLVNGSAIVLDRTSDINVNGNYFNIFSNDSQSAYAVRISGKGANNNITGNEFFMNGNGQLTGVLINNYYDNYYGLSPVNNLINDNDFYLTSDDTAIAVYNSMSDKTTIVGNEINVEGKYAYAVFNDYLPEYKVFMSTVITSNTMIRDNAISGKGENVILIYSKGLKTTVEANKITTSANSSYAYIGNKTSGDVIKYNHMVINGSGISDSFVSHVKQAPLYYGNDSSNVLILENHIVSNYEPGDDYAVYIENRTTGISIKDNYLISDNYNRYSNDAIYAPSAALDNNALYVVYVSVNGSDETGNGSLDNPFRTVKYGLDNVINDGKVYVLSGVYNESDIAVSKTVSLTGIGDVVINSNNSGLFTVSRSGVFTVNDITFVNASAQTGSTFYNNGKLTLKNVTIINSTASAYGGAIYNNADLLVVDSTFDSDSAKTGGAIANNKNADIIDSRFMNNGHMMNISGASIYNSDKGTLNVDGCEFTNNRVDGVYLGNNKEVSDEFGLKYGSGGAIYNRGNIYINDSSFDSNYAFRFGGAIVSRAKLGTKNNVEIANSNFTDNLDVWGAGGALSIENANVKISNSRFVSNSIWEGSGGAVYVASSSGVIYNSTFYKNSAAYGGGAIATASSAVDIIACNITDNNAENGGAFYISSTVSGTHVVEKTNIYNSTITNNRGFNTGSVIFAVGIDINIKNSNIYDNFAGDDTTLSIQSSNNPPNNKIDVNHNWWGSENGPTDDIWLSAQYFRDWDRHMNTWGVLNPDEPEKPDQPSKSGGGQRPVNPDKAVNSGGSTTGTLINNGGSGGNTGSGFGFGTGFGSGYGIGFGKGSGSGQGTGSGTTTGVSTGTGEGSRGSGSGYAGNYTNGEGTLGDMGSASTSGAGGSSSSSQSSSDEGGKAYEISKDIIEDIEENATYLSILLIIIVLILLIIGYKRKSDEEDEL